MAPLFAIFHNNSLSLQKNCENRLRLSNLSELDCIRLALSLQPNGCKN